MINRRNFLLGSGAVSAAAAMGLFPAIFARKADAQAIAEHFEVTLTDDQWHQRLLMRSITSCAKLAPNVLIPAR